MPLSPACIIISNVYVYSLNTLSCIAASRVIALKPLVTSGISVLLNMRTTQLPNFCRNFLVKEKCLIWLMGLAPITISAFLIRLAQRASGYLQQSTDYQHQC